MLLQCFDLYLDIIRAIIRVRYKELLLTSHLYHKLSEIREHWVEKHLF